MRFLVDTNIASEPFKVQPNALVVERFNQNIREMGIAAVMWHELLYGFHRSPESRRKRQLETYLQQIVLRALEILPYDRAAAEWFALERARLTGLERPPSYADGQFAAIAAVNDLVLVTRNVSDYSDFAGLSIENWFE
ncbi:type II toxin-antitoxin system VapC family toxin [Leptolyngbya sp. AN03gr2]|uniref:type II toxin-antitoxin system VapC family toxin n=1 Tax=unclassified Leptolyngbya TaxID=2650499 RepID=UPI003D31D902